MLHFMFVCLYVFYIGMLCFTYGQNKNHKWSYFKTSLLTNYQNLYVKVFKKRKNILLITL